MEDKEKFVLIAELRQAINSGEIENTPKEKLDQWLLALSAGEVANPAVRHNYIIMGIAVNHFRTEQVIGKLEATIKDLNAANDKSQRTIFYLTIIATILAVVATVATVIQAMSIFATSF